MKYKITKMLMSESQVREEIIAARLWAKYIAANVVTALLELVGCGVIDYTTNENGERVYHITEDGINSKYAQ